jgi:glycosyltransferase involved in cell wall biosynthesis
VPDPLPGISILILTLNEEANVEGVLDSVAEFDDIVVLDSGSTDRTVALATARGARVVQRPFDNWAAHHNWALATIEFRHPWIFYLDADERMTPALEQEIRAIAADLHEERVGFYCGRDNFFLGRLIHHCYPPVPILRFYRPACVTYQRLVNPTTHVAGPVGQLRNRFLHYNFSKGLTEWLDKHNRYSQAEAIEAVASRTGARSQLADLLDRDPTMRRAALKRLAWRLPFRPQLKFFWLYVICRGFLDGWPGYVYCRLQATYEYFIDLKIKEIHLARQGRRM